MPPVPEEFFVEAVSEVVRANADYVPPMGKGSFYLRPLLMGTGPILGLGPAPHYEFVVFGAAVGAYFKVCSLLCCPCLRLSECFWIGCLAACLGVFCVLKKCSKQNKERNREKKKKKERKKKGKKGPRLPLLAIF
jgi:hypothetical protein